MSKFLSCGALLALSLVACSGSGDSLTGPDQITPSMDPGNIGGNPAEPRVPITCPPAVVASSSGSATSGGRGSLIRVFAVCPGGTLRRHAAV